MRVAYKTKVAKNSIGKEQECVTDRAAEPEPITKHAALAISVARKATAVGPQTIIAR